MAEKARYPQIPSTVWWGVRSVLKKTPSATIDERLLGVTLGVQEAAAKAYVLELRSVGILSEENKATPLAQKWRLDESYEEAVGQIIQQVYPESLTQVSPPGEGERQKAVQWFLREGLGQGAAGNKAATYLLLASASPNDAPGTVGKASQNDAGRSSSTARAPRSAGSTERVQRRTATTSKADQPGRSRSGDGPGARSEPLPLNINVQIHISADAGTEQIESIFQAMRRYLYDAPDS